MTVSTTNEFIQSVWASIAFQGKLADSSHSWRCKVEGNWQYMYLKKKGIDMGRNLHLEPFCFGEEGASKDHLMIFVGLLPLVP